MRRGKGDKSVWVGRRYNQDLFLRPPVVARRICGRPQMRREDGVFRTAADLRMEGAALDRRGAGEKRGEGSVENRGDVGRVARRSKYAVFCCGVGERTLRASRRSGQGCSGRGAAGASEAVFPSQDARPSLAEAVKEEEDLGGVAVKEGGVVGEGGVACAREENGSDGGDQAFQ